MLRHTLTPLLTLVLLIAGFAEHTRAQTDPQVNPRTEPETLKPGKLLEPLLHEECTVFLRYDVLNAELPPPSLAGYSIDGPIINIVGELVADDDRMIVLELDGTRCWLPREVILMIEADTD